MKITIIGAGNVGGALGKAWAQLGHRICFGVVNPADPKHGAAAAAAGDAIVASVSEAAKGADVLVLAVPWAAVPEALQACGDLTGRILLDATNPLVWRDDGLELALGFDNSGGEEVARMAPGASVFKTMNQVGFEVMADTTGYTSPPLMFVAGDDGQNKPRVMALVAALGFEAVDAGPLRNARLLEPHAMLWIDQATRHGAPLSNAFGMLRKAGAA